MHEVSKGEGRRWRGGDIDRVRLGEVLLGQELPLKKKKKNQDGKPLQDFDLKNCVRFLQDPVDAFGEHYRGQAWKKREELKDIISDGQMRVDSGLDWVLAICQVVRFGMLFGGRVNMLY